MEGSEDSISVALNSVSQIPGLTDFHIAGHIVISKEIFALPRPSKEPGISEPQLGYVPWSEIQYFHLNFNIVAPDGSWYFTSIPLEVSSGEDQDEEDQQNDEEEEEEEEDQDEEEEEEEEEEEGEVEDEDEDEEEEEAEAEEGEEDEEGNGSRDQDSTNDGYNSSSDDGATIDTFSDTEVFSERRWKRRMGLSIFNRFRKYPDIENILPLLRAMALAAAHMPKLKKLYLDARPATVIYLGKGEPHTLDTFDGWGPRNDINPRKGMKIRDGSFSASRKLKTLELRGKRRLYFQTHSWSGDEDEDGMKEVLSLFEKAGEGELVVNFFRSLIWLF
jgi:hypothetical protein